MNQRSGSAHILAWRREGDTFLGQERYHDAIRAYRRILSADAGQADVWYNLGYALKASGLFEEALDAYRRALDAHVSGPQEVRLNRAVILSDHLHRHAQAEEELRMALALQPDYQPALLNLGNLHEERGQREEAVDCYEKLLAASRGQATSYSLEAMARLAQLKPPQRADDPMLAGLRQAIRACQDMPTRANLWFALGKAYDRLGCTDQAFEAFSQANACTQPGGPAYNPRAQERLGEALIAQFATPEPPRGTPAPTPAPLFICGMFRSGSTLLEQALAAHPAIRPGGELEWLPRLVSGELAPFPASMAALDAERIEALAGAYLNQLAQLFPDAAGARYVTDKRPDNFLLIGLIKRLFPDAKILHTVRHPMDNGLSVFMQHLEPRVAPYACGLRAIGHYYAQYRRVMAHWKSLYPDDIHDVDYDALVRAPREVLEPALGFVGLDWDPACLEFHRLGNTVQTASYWQVRQPLYRDASGRWERYAAHLGPLREVLEREGVNVG